MKHSVTVGELFKTLTASMSEADIKSAMVISDISSKIEIERCKRGLTQKQFAEFMGVTQGMVSKWESGDYNFTVESIANIFDKLNLDFEFKITPDLNLITLSDLDGKISVDNDLLMAG